MARQDRSSDSNRTEKVKSSASKDEMVITPAGPVRKGNVHPVGANEVVRRGQDGTYTVTPKTDSK